MSDTIITTPAGPALEPIAGRRISWAAVFAGVITALVVQLLLGVVGLSIGASTIEPLTEKAPAAGLDLGAGIWFAVTGLLALFAGGWVAGRLANVPRRTESALHGLLTWGLATLVMTYIVSTAIGGLISGATGVLGKGLAALGEGAKGAGSALVEQGREELAARGIDANDLKREALALLRDTGKPELQPNNLGAAGERAGQDAQATAGNAAKNPQQADAEISALIDRLQARGGKALDAADRDAAINVIVARTNMSREEAARTVDQWQQTFAQAQQRATELKSQAETRAREAGDKLASGVARTAGWAAFAMILGAIAAGFGGVVGTPYDLLARHRAGFARSREV